VALNLSGIENVEFYSAHYLEALLESDLKGLFADWRQREEEEGVKPPHKRHAPIATSWERAKKQASGERNEVDRWQAARSFHAVLIEFLGYEYAPSTVSLDEGALLPLLSQIDRNGEPYLWIVDTAFSAADEDQALDHAPIREQYPGSVEGDDYQVIPRSPDSKRKVLPASWREILDRLAFRQEHAPRWVLFLAGNQIILAERNKWPSGRFMRFALGDLFVRRDETAIKAMCALLHRDALAPEDGSCLHDQLEESSHKHANAVSSDLKYGVRRAVELLGNEAIYYRLKVQKQEVYGQGDDELALALKNDCLTYLYRLLFLFYVEARGSELGVVPMQSDAYRGGYSLETLRDLELVPLTTDEASNGYFIDHSLKGLFRLLNDGFQPSTEGESLNDGAQEVLRMDPLSAPLFDDKKLSILGGVRFRNHVLQEVLQLLSLSKAQKKKSRGRISYAQLGINQLGAVYEGLLSYSGFFAKEDLYEVASPKVAKELSGRSIADRESLLVDPKLAVFFVRESEIEQYEADEVVRDENELPIRYRKGSFLFRLAGRDRQKSASYYTPEVLTQCLVKYALKELLWEEAEEGAKPTRQKTADEILALTICEPAMGSSAFLIEAVDQLADAYLEARQEEVKARGGETIPPEDYQGEKRRVKARLATNNCYGVDLNPTAVELAKVSLWLATLHEDGKCPWFGLRLATGNSLVGARREVFKTVDVTRKGTKDAPNWLGLVPEPVRLHHGDDAPPPDEVDWANWTAPPRPKGTIYHFLLPAEGMAAFDKDKVIKQLAPESVKRIKEWRKEFCKPFGKKDAERLEQISDAVDRLFAQVVRERVLATQETSDRIPVWGERPSAQQADLLVRDQEEVAASLEDGSSAYRRLKLAMDAWCALWFWPIEEAGLLPDRATWLAQMELILKGHVTHDPTYEQGDLFSDLAPLVEDGTTKSQGRLANVAPLHEAGAERLKRLQGLSEAFRERRAEYVHECGLADIGALLDEDASLRAVCAVAERLHFFHWELRFAETFAKRGGFDVALGNPPWVKVFWDESVVLGDFDPLHLVRGETVFKTDEILRRLQTGKSVRNVFLSEFVESAGLKQMISWTGFFSEIASSQTNLFKGFICIGRWLGAPEGVIAILHDAGCYDSPGDGSLRAALYPSLAAHYQFQNELSLFPEVGVHKRFSISVLRSRPKSVLSFTYMGNLFHPSTIDASSSHDGLGVVPGIRDQSDAWETRGHRTRLLTIDRSSLRLFNDLYEDDDVPVIESRLPTIHCEPLLETLRCIARYPKHFKDIVDRECVTAALFRERDGVEEGLIEAVESIPSDLQATVLSGSHFFVANPFHKQPRENCSSRKDFESIDLMNVSPDFIPRVLFRTTEKGRMSVPTLDGKLVTEYYRFINRKRALPGDQRTLVPTVIPPKVHHVQTCYSIAFKDEVQMLAFCGACSSLVFDFAARTTGKSDILNSVLGLLPVPDTSEFYSGLIGRCLLLSCLTEPYSDLWSRNSPHLSRGGNSTCGDRRISVWTTRSSTWSFDLPLRDAFQRRQALIELDVLTAMMCGLQLQDLSTIYGTQFPLLEKAERSAIYDQHGSKIPTSQTVAGKPAVSLVELAATLKEQAGFDVHAEYHPVGSNTQELRKQKIRLGKKEADVLGVSERCTMADLLAETEVRWSDEDHPEGLPVRLVGLRYTDPGLEPRMERVYPTPWTRCDREADYRQAWTEFERRLGKKMPPGESL
jgi:hypothetical protein